MGCQASTNKAVAHSDPSDLDPRSNNGSHQTITTSSSITTATVSQRKIRPTDAELKNYSEKRIIREKNRKIVSGMEKLADLTRKWVENERIEKIANLRMDAEKQVAMATSKRDVLKTKIESVEAEQYIQSAYGYDGMSPGDKLITFEKELVEANKLVNESIKIIESLQADILASARAREEKKKMMRALVKAKIESEKAFALTKKKVNTDRNAEFVKKTKESEKISIENAAATTYLSDVHRLIWVMFANYMANLSFR